ncbi:hypothetical protein AB0C11_41435, partial [Streptomyces sp. NPDC039016]|uniref:hypothetical protein n=1 Tax=Streptomyces sp. NPDC039016 TaxID=3154330 RepID=UPI0033E071B5
RSSPAHRPLQPDTAPNSPAQRTTASAARRNGAAPGNVRAPRAARRNGGTADNVRGPTKRSD